MPDSPDSPTSPTGKPSGDPYDEIGAIYSGEAESGTAETIPDSPAPPARVSSGGNGGGRDDDDDDDDDDDEDEKDGDPRAKMGFFDHLEELRWMLVKCIVVFGLFFLLNLAFLPHVSNWLQWPIRFGLDIQPDDKLPFELTLNSPMAIFGVAMQIPFILGLGMALPMVVYFVANFVAPGLTKKEKSVLAPSCIAIFFLFLLGAAFSFFVLLPTSIKVAYELGNMMGFRPDWTADSYFELVTWMIIGIGLAFEFPLVLLLLIYVGIVSTETLAQYRTHAFVFFLIFAALITPSTDPVTFLLLGIPLQGLYEVSLWVGKIIEKRKKQAELTD